MSSRCRLFHVDAFTRTRFCGNPARVVLDADDVSDAHMQTIATECNGETAFVLSPASGDHDVQIRFFTPHQEVPFVGHATIAAHYVLAKSGGRSTGVSKQRSRAGIGDIEVTHADGDYRISLSMSPPSLGAILPEPHRSRVLEALGISSPSVHTACPVQMLTKGGARLLIGLQSPALVHALQPEMDALTRLTSQLGAAGYFVFAVAEQQPHFTTVSRMFCPAHRHSRRSGERQCPRHARHVPPCPRPPARHKRRGLLSRASRRSGAPPRHCRCRRHGQRRRRTLGTHHRRCRHRV